jgi:hypothetical protein
MPQQPPSSPSPQPLDTRHSRPSLDIHFLDLPSPFYFASSSSSSSPLSSHQDRSPSISPFTPSKPRFSHTHNRYHHSKPSLSSSPSPSPLTLSWWTLFRFCSNDKHRRPHVDDEGLLSQAGIGSLAEEERWKADRLRKARRRGFLEVLALFAVGVFLLGVVGVWIGMGGMPRRGGEREMGADMQMAEMGLGPRL